MFIQFSRLSGEIWKTSKYRQQDNLFKVLLHTESLQNVWSLCDTIQYSFSVNTPKSKKNVQDKLTDFDGPNGKCMRCKSCDELLVSDVGGISLNFLGVVSIGKSENKAFGLSNVLTIIILMRVH